MGPHHLDGLQVNSNLVYDIQFGEQTYVIGGTVYAPDGVTPVEGIGLRFWRTDNSYNLGGLTNAQGYFEGSGPAGTYYAEVVHDENPYGSNDPVLNIPLPKVFVITLNDPSDEFSVPGGTVPDIILPEPISISGQATDSNGAPIAGVSVNVRTDNDIAGTRFSMWWADTNANGDYSLLLYPGIATIDATPPAGSGFLPNNLNNLVASVSFIQTYILNLPDGVHPIVLSGPLVRSITDTSAVVEWQTDELTLGGIRIGTSNPPTTVINESSYVTLHELDLASLTPNTVYYVQAFATDQSGNGPVDSNIVSFQTLALADIEPPLILDGPVVTSITHNSAVVEWTTSEPADSLVDYDTAEPLTQFVSDSILTTTHSIQLTGLSASTDYFVQVSSTDGFGNGPTSSGIIEFSTQPLPDTTPPVIIGVPMAINVTSTEATIVWQTDEPATSGVSYNDGTAYGVAQDDALVTDHAVHLTGLTPDTLYYFTASSTDAFGNGPTLSGTYTFTTLLAPDTEPPVIIEGPFVKNVNHRIAVIDWWTDEPSDSVIEYGTTVAFGEEENRAALVRHHNLVLHDLLADTEYFFRVSSSDTLGNGPTFSGTGTFHTDPSPGAGDLRQIAGDVVPGDNGLSFTISPQVVGTTDTTATILWQTDEASDAATTYDDAGQTVTVGDGVRRTRHVMTLTNLTPSQDYTFDVKSTDHEGDVASSEYLQSNGFLNFTTDSAPDVTAPVILSGPTFVGLSDDMALVHWTTDEVSDSRVNYGLFGSPLNNFAGEDSLTTDHVVVLTNLTSNVSYSIQSASADVAGNVSGLSGVATASTTSASDSTAPIFTTVPTPEFISVESTTIRWTANEYVVGEVNYGLASNALNSVVSVDGYATSHTASLVNLPANDTIYYQVRIEDIEGNETFSAIQSFSTTIAGLDFDGDGISDKREIQLYGTDPSKADTDNDGVSDYYEIEAGTDPRSPASVGMWTVWVDFYFGGTSTGLQATPFKTFGGGVVKVNPGGTLRVKSGTTAATGMFDKPVTITAEGGLVRIGAL